MIDLPRPATSRPKTKLSAVERALRALSDGGLEIRAAIADAPVLERNAQRRFAGAPAVRLSPSQKATLQWIGKQLEGSDATTPDIDIVSGTVTQGLSVTIGGTGFGTASGRVIASMNANGDGVELNVVSWSETEVVAMMDSNEGGWRSAEGAVYVVRADGPTSNAFPVRVEPARDYYTAFFQHGFGGGLFGWVNHYVLFSNVQVPDPDMRVEEVDVFNSNPKGGDSGLEYPSASGIQLAQGLRLGMTAAQGMVITMRYLVTIPRGIAPPAVTDPNNVADWGHQQLVWQAGDVGWLG